jgi:hypothetical protein
MEGADALSLISYRKQSLPQLFRGIQVCFERIFDLHPGLGTHSFTFHRIQKKTLADFFHSLENFVKQKNFFTSTLRRIPKFLIFSVAAGRRLIRMGHGRLRNKLILCCR